MANLLTTQRNFADALRHPEARPPHALLRSAGVPLARRFDVYRNNVYAGLVDALKATYPAVERLVGCEFFKATARVFLDEKLPSRGTLIGYGEGFPEFLDRFEPARALPYLADVARLELAWLAAYHAADAEPLAAAALGDVAPERVEELSFDLHPSMQLLSSSYPVSEIWRSNRDDAEVAPVDLAAGGENLVVFRPHADVFVANVPGGEMQFLRALRDGLPLGRAAEVGAYADKSFDLAAALAASIERGLFVSYHLDGAASGHE